MGSTNNTKEILTSSLHYHFDSKHAKKYTASSKAKLVTSLSIHSLPVKIVGSDDKVGGAGLDG